MKILNVLIDNGHGESTPGKRSPKWPNGKQLFEWSFNRKVAAKLAEKCKAYPQLKPVLLVPGNEDAGLTKRCNLANAYGRRSIFISIHGNAGPESARGWEIFTSAGATKAHVLAEHIWQEIPNVLPDMKMRAGNSNGYHCKEAKFTVLLKTAMPAVLSENGFFTNFNECMQMLTDDYQDKIAEAHLQGILKFYNDYYADK